MIPQGSDVIRRRNATNQERTIRVCSVFHSFMPFLMDLMNLPNDFSFLLFSR